MPTLQRVNDNKHCLQGNSRIREIFKSCCLVHEIINIHGASRMKSSMNSPVNEGDLRDRADSESSLEDDTESRSDVKKLYTTLDSIGYGFFHLILLLVSGWALASDSVEILCVSFISPAAHEDLQLTRKTEGWLDASIFIGMMIGGYFWGGWADAVGRRTCLLNSLLLNGGSGLVSAFMPNYGWFLACRILSGIGYVLFDCKL